jgi:hypothetical protein
MKTIKMFAVGSLALFAVACTDPVQRDVEQIDDYVTRVEAEYENYDEADWEQADLEFETLRQEIDANYESMTPEQQQAAMRAIGRYYGLMTKRGIETVTREAQKALESVPSILEGFKDAFSE